MLGRDRFAAIAREMADRSPGDGFVVAGMDVFPRLSLDDGATRSEDCGAVRGPAGGSGRAADSRSADEQSACRRDEIANQWVRLADSGGDDDTAGGEPLQWHCR